MNQAWLWTQQQPQPKSGDSYHQDCFRSLKPVLRGEGEHPVGAGGMARRAALSRQSEHQSPAEWWDGNRGLLTGNAESSASPQTPVGCLEPGAEPFSQPGPGRQGSNMQPSVIYCTPAQSSGQGRRVHVCVFLWTGSRALLRFSIPKKMLQPLL